MTKGSSMALFDGETVASRLSQWFCGHWLILVSSILGLFVLLPFLAPVFMSFGLSIPARLIYWVYSFLCHQLPERSYFLFGPKISYSLPEIQSIWQNTANIAILRQFVGNSQMGWKVAWSDRMVSMYTSLWLFGILWGITKKRSDPLPLWALLIFLLPMAIDGTTHLISDLSGIGQGFRYSNEWLASITNNIFPAVFYSGDAWGSFNSWMRLLTGMFFGFGIVWFAFPLFEETFMNTWEAMEYKTHYRSLLQNEKERLSQLRLAADPEQMTDPV
ncbi:MAG: DUF2085 domain-containing protein, partial [Anaerolineaceae bacterium]